MYFILLFCYFIHQLYTHIVYSLEYAHNLECTSIAAPYLKYIQANLYIVPLKSHWLVDATPPPPFY